MDRDAEIDQIQKELEILHARYALYGRWGRILKVFFIIWIPLFAVGILAIFVKLFQFDVLYCVFFAGAMLTFGIGFFWLNRADPRDKLRPLRWIDFASPTIRSANPYNNFRSFFLRRNVSDAELIEEQIADRERRLSELGYR